MLSLKHQKVFVKEGLNSAVGQVVGQLSLRVEGGVDQVVESDSHEV